MAVAERAIQTPGDGKTEISLKIPDPVYIITDLTNDLSPAECQARIGKIFRSRGFITEFTPNVHDVKEFDPIDGGFNLRQLAVTHDRPLDEYDQERAIIDHKPGVFGVVVDPGVGTDRRVVVVETESGNRYVGPDNGVLSFALARETVTSAWAVNEERDGGSSVTFQGRDRILRDVARLASGDKPEKMDHLDRIDPQSLAKNQIKQDMVIHRDGYGNLKLGQEGFPTNETGERPTSVKLKLPRRSLRNGLFLRRTLTVPTARTFGEVSRHKPLIYAGSSGDKSLTGEGHLEFAINLGNAARKYDLYVGDEIGIQWYYPSDPVRRRIGGLRRR